MRTLPDHGDGGAAGDELDEALIEGLALVLGVVLLRDGAAALHQLHADLQGDTQRKRTAALFTHEDEALLLEASDDFSNEAALDASGE